MSSYAVELKPSARKELDSLPDNVLTRVIQQAAIPDARTKARRMQEVEGL